MNEGHSLRIRLLHETATLPKYGSTGASGLDLSAHLQGPQVLEPGAQAAIPTGIAIQLPAGHEGQVRPRSGLARRHGVTVLNSPGTIDEDYRGEIVVLLINHGPAPVTLLPGERIAQLVVAPVTRVTLEVAQPGEALSETTRGTDGFGSTGRS